MPPEIAAILLVAMHSCASPGLEIESDCGSVIVRAIVFVALL
jgi:hypothetical protein